MDFVEHFGGSIYKKDLIMHWGLSEEAYQVVQPPKSNNQFCKWNFSGLFG